jgi:hypothetical protein
MSALAAAAAKSTPFIDWASLGKVAGVSLIFGVAIVTIFSVGIVGLSWYHGEDGSAAVGQGTSRNAGLAMASVSFVLCAAAVVYGLYLIIPQFH